MIECYGLSDRHAKRSIAIEHSDTDLDLGDLPVEVPRHERLAHQFQAVHPLTGSRLLANDERFRFDATSSVVSAPTSPHGAAQISLRVECIVPGDRSLLIHCPAKHASMHERGFPGLCILTWQDHRVGISGGNSLVAFTRIVGAVCGDTADVLIGRDLVQEFG